MPTLDAAGLTAVALPVQAQAHSLQYAEPLERSTELSDSQAADVSDERRNGTAQLAVDTGEELSDVEEQQANKRDKAKRPHLKVIDTFLDWGNGFPWLNLGQVLC